MKNKKITIQKIFHLFETEEGFSLKHDKIIQISNGRSKDILSVQIYEFINSYYNKSTYRREEQIFLLL